MLDQMQTLQATQSKNFNSEINKQLSLLAGIGGSQEYVELDHQIESLQTELRTVLTNIDSLKAEARDAAMTQAKMDSLNAEFQTVRGQLDIAKEERSQMVAQARDTIRLNVQPFLEGQQAELAEALESATEPLGPLHAARTDAAAKAPSLQKQFGAVAGSIASLELLDFSSPQRYISASLPAEPRNYTPPPPMRKRDSLVFGGGVGLTLAWLMAGFIDFRRSSHHQPSAPAERGPGQGSPGGTGRVRGWLASLRGRGPDTQPSVPQGPAP